MNVASFAEERFSGDTGREYTAHDEAASISRRFDFPLNMTLARYTSLFSYAHFIWRGSAGLKLASSVSASGRNKENRLLKLHIGS